MKEQPRASLSMFGVVFASDINDAKYSGGNQNMQEERLRMANGK